MADPLVPTKSTLQLDNLNFLDQNDVSLLKMTVTSEDNDTVSKFTFSGGESRRLTGLSYAVEDYDVPVYKQVQHMLADNDKVKGTVDYVTFQNISDFVQLSHGRALNGVAIAEGEKVLCMGQDTKSENGVYLVSALGVTAARHDMLSNTDDPFGAIVTVSGQSHHNGMTFQCVSSGVIGSDDLEWRMINSGDSLIVVAAASTAGITTSTLYPDGSDLSIDGQTILHKDFVLLKDQAVLSENGLYQFEHTVGELLERKLIRVPHNGLTGQRSVATSVSVIAGTTNESKLFSIPAEKVIGTDDIEVTELSQNLMLRNRQEQISGAKTFEAKTEFSLSTPAADLDVGAVVVHGGVNALNFYADGENEVSHFAHTTPAASPTTGAVTVAGGAGIGQNLYIGSASPALTDQNTPALNTAALNVSGGASIAENVMVYSAVPSDRTNNSHSSDVASIKCDGGFAVAGASTVWDATPSNDSATGCLVAKGGVGVNLDIYAGGDINATGSMSCTQITTTSDERKKTGIAEILDTAGLHSLRPVSYTWKDESKDQKLQFGLIAQEVEQVFPNAVEIDSQGFYSMNYIAMIPLLIKEVQKLRAELDSLKQA